MEELAGNTIDDLESKSISDVQVTTTPIPKWTANIGSFVLEHAQAQIISERQHWLPKPSPALFEIFQLYQRFREEVELTFLPLRVGIGTRRRPRPDSAVCRRPALTSPAAPTSPCDYRNSLSDRKP